MLVVKAGWKYIVKVEYDAIEKVEEFHDVRFLHTRESGHPAKCGCNVFLQEEYPSIRIG